MRWEDFSIRWIVQSFIDFVIIAEFIVMAITIIMLYISMMYSMLIIMILGICLIISILIISFFAMKTLMVLTQWFKLLPSSLSCCCLTSQMFLQQILKFSTSRHNFFSFWFLTPLVLYVNKGIQLGYYLLWARSPIFYLNV